MICLFAFQNCVWMHFVQCHKLLSQSSWIFILNATFLRGSSRKDEKFLFGFGQNLLLINLSIIQNRCMPSCETNASLAAFHSRFQVNSTIYACVYLCFFFLCFGFKPIIKKKKKIYTNPFGAVRVEAIVIHPVNLNVFGIPCTRA